MAGIGYPKDKANVDGIVGELAREMRRNFRKVMQFKVELDTYNDATITGLGYTAGEVADLRSFAADMDQLAAIYEGRAALAVAKDFRVSSRKAWGILGDN